MRKKDEKPVPTTTTTSNPKTLPMPKYHYQSPQNGSFSVKYRAESEKGERCAAELRNIHFG